MRHLLVIAVVTLVLSVSVAVVAVAEVVATCLPSSESTVAVEVRTDHQASGNRVAAGCASSGSFAADVVDLGFAAAWVVPDPRDPGGSWIATREDGRLFHVDMGQQGSEALVSELDIGLRPGEPPQLRLATTGDGSLEIRSAFEDLDGLDDALPGSRIVRTADGTSVGLTGPTRRYQHGVLGDDIEAAALRIERDDGSASSANVGSAKVIEGLAPMLLDLHGDGSDPEIIVTVSDAAQGARLVVFDLAAARVANSKPIGQGFRWLHQIGGGPSGPDGETEVIVVRTPHIGGIVEAYQLIDGHLRLVASASGYSSHRIGSPNLDMALLADTDADGRLEVIVPTQGMRTLAVLSRTTEGFEVDAQLPLEARLVSNVAAASDMDGALVLAAATDDGRLRVFR